MKLTDEQLEELKQEIKELPSTSMLGRVMICLEELRDLRARQGVHTTDKEFGPQAVAYADKLHGKPNTQNEAEWHDSAKAFNDGMLAARQGIAVWPSEETALIQSSKLGYTVEGGHHIPFVACYRWLRSKLTPISLEDLKSVRDALDFTFENNGTFCGRNKCEKAKAKLNTIIEGVEK